MGDHLKADSSNSSANEDAGTLAAFYYKGFSFCFLLHGIKPHGRSLRSSFMR